MRKGSRIALLALVALGLSCADEPQECTISATGEGGLQLLTCPDGSVLVVGGETSSPCIKVVEENGWGRIVCEDGTQLLVDPDGNLHFPGKGAIMGEARLWGEEKDHGGIEVRVEGVDLSTRTDAAGRYHLAQLPAGIYHLRFQAQGRVPEVRRNIPVIDGTFQMETVELRIGGWVAADPNAGVFPSPSGESALILDTSAGGLLTLLHLPTWERVVLSYNAVSPSFRPDGREVFWVENLSSRSRVMRHVLETRETVELPSRGIEAHPLGDGRAVVVRSVPELVETLTVTDLLEGDEVELGRWIPRQLAQLPMSAGGALVFHGLDQTLLYDHANRSKALLADVRVDLSRVTFHPQGRRVTFTHPADGAVELRQYDLGLGEVRTLEAALDSPLGSPVSAASGSLLWRGRSGWRMWDAPRDEVIYLGNDDTAAFLPDGSGVVLWAGGFRGASTASLYLRDGGERTLLSSQALSLPISSSDAAYLAVPVDEGEGPATRVFDRKGGSRSLEGHGWSFPLRSHLVRVDSARNVWVADAASGKVETIFGELGTLGSGADDLLLAEVQVREDTWRHVAIWDTRSGRTHWLGPGTVSGATTDDRYLFFTGCKELRCDRLIRFDRANERQQLVDTKVPLLQPSDRTESFLLYRLQAEEEERIGLYLVPLLYR